MTNRNCVIFVNGERHEIVGGTIAHCTTAYDYLREHLELRSLKRSSKDCAAGSNMGAVIMVTSLSPATGVIEGHKAVDALSTPVIALHGTAVSTLEAMGSRNGLHPIQARLVASGALLCGYCVPGICVLLYTLLMNNMQPTVREVDRALAGLWCRCSGFRSVLDVARSFAVDCDEALRVRMATDGDVPAPESLDNYPPALSDQAEGRVVISSATRIAMLRKLCPLYPHEHLKPPTIAAVPPLFLFYGLNETAFLLPTSVDEVIRSCKVVPDYTTINGADDFHNLVLERAESPEGPPMGVLSTSRVKEMLELSLKAEGPPTNPQYSVFIGAAATYSSISQRIPKLITNELNQKDPWTVAALVELRSAIDELSATQIEENTLTLVGHMMKRPCGDLVPFLHCLGATLIVLTSKGREELSVQAVTGASRSIAKLDVLVGIKIPSQRNRFVGFAKATLAGPRSPASASVALTCEIARRDNNDIVASDFSVACAGSSFYMTVLPDVASSMDKTSLSNDTIRNLRNALDKLLMSLRNLVHGPSDGRVSYRITVTRSLIFRLMCKLQVSVGVPPMDASALRLDSAQAAQCVTFGVQSWEDSFGGLYNSHHQPNLDEQEEVVETPSVSSVGSPNADHPQPQQPASGGTAAKPPGGKAPTPGNVAPGKKAPLNSTASPSNNLGVPVSDAPTTVKSPNVQSAAALPPAAPIKRMITRRSPVGDATPTIASTPHALGQTCFVGDTPMPKGCLHAAFVRSTITKGIIKGINTAPALAYPGVLAYYDGRNLPVRDHSKVFQAASVLKKHGALGMAQQTGGAPGGTPMPHNTTGDATSTGIPEAVQTEELPRECMEWAQRIFSEKDVDFVGQVIGIVVATSSAVARQAAQLVSVEYVKDHRVSCMLSIQECREAKSFFPTTDAEVLSTAASPVGGAAGRSSMPLRKLFENKDLTTFSGTFSVGGQFAMTAEPTTVLAMPGADDVLDVCATTEDPSKVHQLIAAKLLVPQSAVRVTARKLGGPQPDVAASASMATAVAFAAMRLQRPVLFVSSLEDDTATRGMSHSTTVDWRCVVDPVTNVLLGADVQVYLNCGAHKGNAEEILRSILRHVSSGYHVQMLRARGVLCKTNYPPMTAHVGVGPAIGMLIMENIVDALARNLKVARWKLQQDHLLQPNETLPYGQLPQQVRMPTVWQDLIISANVGDRMVAAQQYNQAHRYRKRGIAMVPVLVGCRLPTADGDHRATATVTLFSDGTALVRHGVVDSGCGVDTKVAQVVARALKLPMSLVRIGPTSTESTDVTYSSATHMSADAACLAVLNACEILLKRLEPVVQTTAPNARRSLGELVRAASEQQISMVAVGTAGMTSRHLPNSRSSSPSPRGGGGGGGDPGEMSRHNSVGPGLLSFNPLTPTESAASLRPPICGTGVPGHLVPQLSQLEPFAYFVQGVACSEVELDVLTGSHKVVRADVLLDAGQSINPLIDIALIEQQFIKGAGWLTTEEVVCGDTLHPDVPEGTFFNASIRNGYLMPRLHDAIPQDFRVALFGGATTSNSMGGIHGARSVQDASLMLGASVMFALREAAYAARVHWSEARPPFMEMHAPLTAERLRMACTDEFSQGSFAGAECVVIGSY